MLPKEERKSIEATIKKRFGETEGLMLYTLVSCAIAEQPVDITTLSGKRFLEVTVDPSFIYMFMYGAGPFIFNVTVFLLFTEWALVAA